MKIHLIIQSYENCVFDEDLPILTEEELNVVDSFGHAQNRIEFIFRRAALKRFLSQFLNCPISDITIKNGVHGKPELATFKGISFSVSRSNNFFILTATDLGQIGVDIESIRPVAQTDYLIRHVFTKTEQAKFNFTESQERDFCFYDIWTKKEAIFKAEGAADFNPALINTTDWEATQPVRSFYVESITLIGSICVLPWPSERATENGLLVSESLEMAIAKEIHRVNLGTTLRSSLN